MGNKFTPPPIRKVLVLGGTGAMGAHLVHLLANNGINTVVTSRKARQSEENVRYIQGNAHDIEFLKEVLREHWDVVINFMIYTTEIFKERVDLLLNATDQYIFLSSARVYGNDEPVISEASPRLLESSHDKEFLATDEYALAKARQEDVLRNSGRKNWTIIRPYITYSENRLQLGVLEKEMWLYRALHGKTIVFSSDICEKLTTLTYGLDVASGIAAIIGKPEALGETFHITVDKSKAKTWAEILDVYLAVLEKHLGHRPKVMLQNMDKFLELRPGNTKYQVLYDRLFNRVFDISKISHYIDTDSFIKPEIGLVNCLEAFLKNPQFKDIDWGLMAKMDRQAGESTSLIKISGIKQKAKYLIFKLGLEEIVFLLKAIRFKNNKNGGYV
jgi:nucleoside-diphosphate-sugar epimerase